MKTADIESVLRSRAARLEQTKDRRHAAVAMIVREREAALDMLFIERARHDGDPWSGDLGFPGGKIEAGDEDAKSAAERETREEIGLDLTRTRYLGRLDDLRGAHLPVVVSCFVYRVDCAHSLRLNHEVEEVHWVPLESLWDPGRHRETTVIFRNEPLVRPAIDLLGAGRPVLWGITYRLVRQLKKRLDGEEEKVS